MVEDRCMNQMWCGRFEAREYWRNGRWLGVQIYTVFQGRLVSICWPVGQLRQCTLTLDKILIKELTL